MFKLVVLLLLLLCPTMIKGMEVAECIAHNNAKIVMSIPIPEVKPEHDALVPIPRHKPIKVKVVKKTSKDYIPEAAYKFLPVVKTEVTNLFPDIPEMAYVPSLIEHESCISLTHSKCWNPSSRLKTAREEGAGLGQLTRAYDKAGKIRFDSLTEMVGRYPRYLNELKWSNIYDRPDLQIRALLLMSKGNYDSLYSIKDNTSRLAMADAAYNGGLGGLRKEIVACGLSKDCNPQLWFDNVELHCLKSKKILYANRNACDINRQHTRDVLNTRLNKYKLYFEENTQ